MAPNPLDIALRAREGRRGGDCGGAPHMRRSMENTSTGLRTWMAITGCSGGTRRIAARKSGAQW